MKTDHRKVSAALLTCLFLTLVFPMFTFWTVPTALASLDNPNTVTIAGSLQSEAGCSGDWQPDCAATHMTKRADGIWEYSVNLQAGSYEYKAVIDDAWANGNYGKNAKYDGPNISLNLNAP